MARKRKNKQAVPEEIVAEGSGGTPVRVATDAEGHDLRVVEEEPVAEVVFDAEEPLPPKRGRRKAPVTVVDVAAEPAALADAAVVVDADVAAVADADVIEAADVDAGEDAISADVGAEADADPAGAAMPTSAATMSDDQLKHLVEALVFAADKPITIQRLRQLSRVSEIRRLEQALAELTVDYATRGVVLQQVSGGYQFRTQTQFSGWVQQLIAGRPVRLSRAQLETLAIVAYRQPITRPEIDDIRGVDSSATLKLLMDRTLIRILGKREEVGRPMLYGTTKEFLDFFSLGDLRELPTLREYSELTDESRRVMTDRLGIDPGGHDPEGGASPGGGGGGVGGGDGGGMGGGGDGGVPSAEAGAAGAVDASAGHDGADSDAHVGAVDAIAGHESEAEMRHAEADAHVGAAEDQHADASHVGRQASDVQHDEGGSEVGAHVGAAEEPDAASHVGRRASEMQHDSEADAHVGAAEDQHADASHVGRQASDVQHDEGGSEVGAHVGAAEEPDAASHVGRRASEMQHDSEADAHVGAVEDQHADASHVGRQASDVQHDEGGSEVGAHVGAAEEPDAASHVGRRASEMQHDSEADAHVGAAEDQHADASHVGRQASDVQQDEGGSEVGAHVGAAEEPDAASHVGRRASEMQHDSEADAHVGAAEDQHGDASHVGRQASDVQHNDENNREVGAHVGAAEDDAASHVGHRASEMQHDSEAGADEPRADAVFHVGHHGIDGDAIAASDDGWPQGSQRFAAVNPLQGFGPRGPEHKEHEAMDLASESDDDAYGHPDSTEPTGD